MVEILAQLFLHSQRHRFRLARLQQRQFYKEDLIASQHDHIFVVIVHIDNKQRYIDNISIQLALASNLSSELIKPIEPQSVEP